MFMLIDKIKGKSFYVFTCPIRFNSMIVSGKTLLHRLNPTHPVIIDEFVTEIAFFITNIFIL